MRHDSGMEKRVGDLASRCQCAGPRGVPHLRIAAMRLGALGFQTRGRNEGIFSRPRCAELTTAEQNGTVGTCWAVSLRAASPALQRLRERHRGRHEWVLRLDYRVGRHRDDVMPTVPALEGGRNLQRSVASELSTGVEGS